MAQSAWSTDYRELSISISCCECQYSLCNKTRDSMENAGGIVCLITDWRMNELQSGDLLMSPKWEGGEGKKGDGRQVRAAAAFPTEKPPPPFFLLFTYFYVFLSLIHLSVLLRPRYAFSSALIFSPLPGSAFSQHSPILITDA